MLHKKILGAIFFIFVSLVLLPKISEGQSTTACTPSVSRVTTGQSVTFTVAGNPYIWIAGEGNPRFGGYNSSSFTSTFNTSGKKQIIAYFTAAAPAVCDVMVEGPTLQENGTNAQPGGSCSNNWNASNGGYYQKPGTSCPCAYFDKNGNQVLSPRVSDSCAPITPIQPTQPGTPSPETPSRNVVDQENEFAIGDRAIVNIFGENARLNVRSSGSLLGLVIGVQAQGAQGTIVGGPRTDASSRGSRTWWNIDFDSGVDGWVAGDFVERVGGPRPPATGATTNQQANALVPEIKFPFGSRVEVAAGGSSSLNVRNIGSTGGLLRGAQPNGSKGFVINETPYEPVGTAVGARITNGVVERTISPNGWYQVDFDSGADGWVSGEFLIRANESVPPLAQNTCPPGSILLDKPVSANQFGIIKDTVREGEEKVYCVFLEKPTAELRIGKGDPTTEACTNTSMQIFAPNGSLLYQNIKTDTITQGYLLNSAQKGSYVIKIQGGRTSDLPGNDGSNCASKQNTSDLYMRWTAVGYHTDPHTQLACKDGTPPSALGGYSVVATAKAGEVMSWCIPVPESATDIQVYTRNHRNVACGEREIMIKPPASSKYSTVWPIGRAGEPFALMTQIGGSCGWFRPGCTDRVPGGMYEIRMTGLTDLCPTLSVDIGVSGQ